MRGNNFIIPFNFRDAGTTLNGMATKRNLFEGIVIALVGVLIVRLIPIEGDLRLTIYILVGGFGFVAGCAGVNGDPLSAFVGDFFGWIKRRKPYIYNNHGSVFKTSAADLLLEQPQFRDTLANALDKVRLSLASKQVDYVEGETFQFASDPELAALSEADKKLDAKAEELRRAQQEAQAEQEASSKQEEVPAPTSTGLDIASAIDKIMLHDEEESDG